MSTMNERPNLVVVLVDDLGWMDVGCYGSTYYETPNIDRLATQGMRFTQAYSACPVCSPSRAALLTGKNPARLRFTGHITAIERHRYPDHGRIIPPDDRMYISLDEVTIANALKPAGYTSASIGKWHVGIDPKYWPTGQGFDLNVAGHSHGSPPSYWFPYRVDREWNTEIPTLKGGKPGEYLTDRLTDESIKFIRDNRKDPFLLYLPHYAVHTPLQAPADLVEKYTEKMKVDSSQKSPIYAAMIENVDRNLGRLLETLDELGLTDNTAVIFASDNGGANVATNNAPLREGKAYLYEGGIRVPLIVKWPGHVPEGRTCDAQVAGEDLYPTIIEMAGEGTISNEVVDGMSMLPLLTETPGWREHDLHWYYPHYPQEARMPGAAIRSGDYKLIQHYDPERIELYNLAEDLGEEVDLSRKMPGKASELLEKLEGWLRSVDAQMHTLNPEYMPGLDEEPT